ncbi:MAG: hypothetical protein HN353_03365 [Bdellovibrionales bacterium]|jgi:hypothetical protein|nr:hypothetical protein [Bdellovibrionales bacterium]MBT3526077.1 hypothetical protein [Bdellovibrionales bacterium]MBT7668515.1 hypothetical protein [Bdellovibrionales bacterium]MBT7767323.1 hypothetical protein [Bdellovibrionales bacterium]
MKKFLYSIPVFLLASTLFLLNQAIAGQVCDIFIPGYNAEKYVENEDYFGRWDKQVYWNSQQEIPAAAAELAPKILATIDQHCPLGSAVVIRAHSYGVSVVSYILGKGHRYVGQFPQHEFVKIYRRVFALYSYTGAFHGTSIMDILCSNGLINKLAGYFSQACVLSLTTATNHHPFFYISSVGVPIYLIYSTDRSPYGGVPGMVISKWGISWTQFAIEGKRNQNDSVLPTFSTRGCATTAPLLNSDSNCLKLDPDYMLDFHWLESTSHNEFLDNPRIMWMKYETTSP